MRVLVEVGTRRELIENVTSLKLDVDDPRLVRIEHTDPHGEKCWRLFAPDQARIEILP